MTTKNPTIVGRPQRLQMTKLGALLVLAAPMAAFSGGCSVEQGVSSEGNVGQTEQALTTCVTIKRGDGTVADARISKAAKNQNFGSNPVLQVAEKDETLIRFDLSGIPASAAINSATLKLYSQGQQNNNDDDDDDCDNDDEHRIRIHRAKASWAEGSVTYKNFNQQYDGATAGILAPAQNSALQSANVKGLVTQWVSGAKPNYGFLLEKDDDDKTVFSSSESNNAALRPALEVCYTTPDANNCAPNPCVNGTCSNTQNSYTCACDAGWTGTNCETNINECAGNPCQNAGVCTDGANSYSCACAPGYAGTNCETNVDECASAPCVNGGVCTDGVNSYSCSCEPGFSGTNCETNIDECAGVPCQNGGTCTDGANSYTCACPAGYTGTNCETDIDDCASTPCGNGTCIDGVNSYTCSCDPGFNGANCENNIDECAGAPCLNGGSCSDGLLSYTCACAPGYTGTNCEVDINDCASNPCQNGGICVDGVNSYSCSCTAGYAGTNCETSSDACSSNPCQNGGTCTNDGQGGYTCACSSVAWTGPNCATSGCPCVDLPEWSTAFLSNATVCAFYADAGLYIEVPTEISYTYAYTGSGFCLGGEVQMDVTAEQDASCQALLLERDAAGANRCAPCLGLVPNTCPTQCDAIGGQSYCQ